MALVIAAQTSGVVGKTVLPAEFREYLDAGTSGSRLIFTCFCMYVMEE